MIPSLRDIIEKLNEAERMSGPEVDTVTGPAYWASYLINGDASGMDEDEIKACDRWQDNLKPWYVVGTTTDEETGESHEPYFTWHYDLHSGTDTKGGDVIDYVVHKDRGASDEPGSVVDEEANPLDGYKLKPVQGLYSYSHFQHPNGSFIQLRHPNHPNDFHAVHQDAGGNRTTHDSLEGLKNHLKRAN